MSTRVIALLLAATCCLASGGQLAHPTSDVLSMRGRVVMFDWSLHSLDHTYAEDLVVRTTEPRGGTPRYIRVVYPGVAHLAPGGVKASYALPRGLFVARGDVWTFRLHEGSRYPWAACRRNFSRIRLSDDLGTIELPPFSRTPGADSEAIPSLDSLPCFVMEDRPTTTHQR